MKRTLRVLIATVVLLLGLGMVVFPMVQRAAAETLQEAFIRGLVPAAQDNERATGIPASVAIGQAALETGWGRSSMAQAPINSYFSIKCTSTPSPYQNGCVAIDSYEYDSLGNKTLKTSNFRTYATVGDSVLDYGRLLSTASRYKPAFAYTDDADQFIREVHKAGYATDPSYADTVIGIMGRYGLYQYNLLATTPKPAPSTPDPSTSEPSAPTSTAAPVVPDVPVTQSVPPVLRTGSRGGAVSTLQSLLNHFSGAGLSVDGIFGQATDKAVRGWQGGAGLGVTGVMDEASWRDLLPGLARGSQGPAVVALQQSLTRAGYTVPATGNFLDMTVAAVRKLQGNAGLDQTGSVDFATWSSLLNSAPAATTNSQTVAPAKQFPTYANGTRKAGVKTLQLLLNAYGGASLSTDGIFGRATEQAVRNWQQRAGLSVTGVMDDASWRRLAPRLSYGTRSGGVTALQIELTQAGLTVSNTGYFGPVTKDQVSRLQQRSGLKVTGVADAEVWVRLID